MQSVFVVLWLPSLRRSTLKQFRVDCPPVGRYKTTKMDRPPVGRYKPTKMDCPPVGRYKTTKMDCPGFVNSSRVLLLLP
jgi:hypothetical protein